MKRHSFSKKIILLCMLMITGVYSYSAFASYQRALDDVIKRLEENQESIDRVDKILKNAVRRNNKLRRAEVEIKEELEQLAAGYDNYENYKKSLVNDRDNSDALEATNKRFSTQDLNMIQSKLDQVTNQNSKLYFSENAGEHGHYRYFLTGYNVYRMCFYCPTDKKNNIWSHSNDNHLFDYSCSDNYGSRRDFSAWDDAVLPSKERDKKLYPVCYFPDDNWISRNSKDSIDGLIDKLTPSCNKEEFISQYKNHGSNKKICSKGLTHNKYEAYTQCLIIGPEAINDMYMRCNEKLEWSVKTGDTVTRFIESLINND